MSNLQQGIYGINTSSMVVQGEVDLIKSHVTSVFVGDFLQKIEGKLAHGSDFLGYGSVSFDI